MSPPRILQLTLSLNPGGTERLVVELASRLNDEMPTAVCCLDEVGSWGCQLARRGIEVSALGRQPGFRPSLGASIAEIAKRHGASVIHAHHYSPFVYACLARAYDRSLRVVFTEHGRLSDTPPSMKRRLANVGLRAVPEGVFAVSDHLKTHMVAEGFAAGAVKVVYNGIGLGPAFDAADKQRVRRDLGIDHSAFVVGTIARLDPVKDLETLLRARAHLRTDAPLIVLIVGDGPERARLEAAAIEHRVADQVRFLGHREDARWCLAACDAYVNCSITEGVSLTILEAMAARLPIIATRVGGTPEVIDDSCGRLIEPRDAAGLTSHVQALVASPALRTELGEAARRRVETRFTIERMTREYSDIYRSTPRARTPLGAATVR